MWEFGEVNSNKSSEFRRRVASWLKASFEGLRLDVGIFY